MEKLNSCVCGKQFTSNSSLASHGLSCKEYQLDKYGSLDNFYRRKHNLKQRNIENAVDRIKNMVNTKNKNKLKNIEIWISEKHTCERCGKVMDSYFGSGRFCSRSCANSRTLSDESKKKTSIKLKRRICFSNNAGELIYLFPNEQIPEGFVKGNFKNSKFNSFDDFVNSVNDKENNKCVICGKAIPRNQTCSKECYKKLLSIKLKKSVINKGGNLNSKRGFYSGKCKYGTYKGIECDSSYELAFVIYCIDHEIDIVRNHDYFQYTIEGKNHNYFPDFKLGDIYIEIKGYIDNHAFEKYNQFPLDKYIVLIYGNMMTRFLKYCITTYGNEFTKMYDEDKPHWKYN